jgi:hypothetical protein
MIAAIHALEQELATETAAQEKAAAPATTKTGA